VCKTQPVFPFTSAKANSTNRLTFVLDLPPRLDHRSSRKRLAGRGVANRATPPALFLQMESEIAPRGFQKKTIRSARVSLWAGTKTRRGSAVLVDRGHHLRPRHLPRRVCLHVAQSVPAVEAPLLPPGVGSFKVVPAPSLLYRRPNLTSEIGMHLPWTEHVPRVSVEHGQRSVEWFDQDVSSWNKRTNKPQRCGRFLTLSGSRVKG
jgi:hypothetical protein